MNLLNVRGLVVAQNPLTGEDIWLLVGIQADVSKFNTIPEDQLAAVAKRIRRKLVKQFATLGTSAVLKTGGSQLCIPEVEHSGHIRDSVGQWRIVPDAIW